MLDYINATNLKEMLYVYAPEYYIWSLEIHYLCFLVNKNKEPTSDELKEIANQHGINIHQRLPRSLASASLNDEEFRRHKTFPSHVLT